MVTIVAFLKDEAQQYGVQVARVQCKPNAEELLRIRNLVNEGKLRAQVATILPFEEVKQALQLSATGRTRHKIVLQITAG